MKFTKNDLVCYVDDDLDDDIDIIDFLIFDENVISKPFIYYNYNEKEQKIKIHTYIDLENIDKGTYYFFNNFFSSRKINLVDSINGYFEDCFVERIKLNTHMCEEPFLELDLKVTKLTPWEIELPYNCYATNDASQGVLSEKTLIVSGKDSINISGIGYGYGYGYGLNSFYSNDIGKDIYTTNVEFLRNGTVNGRHIFVIPAQDTNFKFNSDYINSIKSNMEESLKDKNKIDFAIDDYLISIKDVKIKELTYVYDNTILPVKKHYLDKINKMELTWFSIYYSGRFSSIEG